MNISKQIIMPNLENIRDLGGIITKSNRRIRRKAFIRSESLCRAKQEDLVLLDGITAVYDLRSPFEARYSPDNLPLSAKYYHFPLLDDELSGSDASAYDGSFFDELAGNKDLGYQQMLAMYENIAINNNSRKNLGLILRKMLEDYHENENSCFLFHCTSGKDRCGFLSALILELLGVNREDIMDDYLSTNAYLHHEKDKIKAMMMDMIPANRREMLIKQCDKLMDDYCTCKREYLLRSYQAIDQKYGSINAYIIDGLNLDESFVIDFQKSFLE